MKSPAPHLRPLRAADPRARVLAQLAAVRAAIAGYDDWAANARLPTDQRRALSTPPLRRESLEALHRALVAELDHLDGATGQRRAA